jgi:hypothetical protein
MTDHDKAQEEARFERTVKRLLAMPPDPRRPKPAALKGEREAAAKTRKRSGT